jgi:hypothetical protein
VFLETTLVHLGLIIADHFLETHTDSPTRLPLQTLFGTRSIWSPLLRVIRRQTFMNDLDAAFEFHTILRLHLLDDVADEFCELEDREFVWVADVDGASLGRVHKRNKPVDEIVDVLEGARLRAIAVHGQILAAERLDDEVGYDTTIERVHARAIRVENTRNADIDVVLAVEAICERLGDALALVVAGARSDGVHVAPAKRQIKWSVMHIDRQSR